MKKLTAFATIGSSRLTFASVGALVMCQFALAQGNVVERTIAHNGTSRDYLLFVPSTYAPEKSHPLVFMLHGFGTSAPIAMIQSELNDVAETDGFLVAYPNAVSGDWNGGEDNVDFVATGLLNDIASEYSVDPARVYSTGWSQGGVLSYALAASRPDTIAAVAAVSGTPFTPAWLPEKPSSPFPVLHVHGTADPLAPYHGGAGIWGGTFPAVPEFIDEFAIVNGCLESTTLALPNKNDVDGTTVDVISYENCATYVDVEGTVREATVSLYRVNGMAHTWPGDEDQPPANEMPTLWPANFDFEASETIWAFFKEHRLAWAPTEADCSGDGIVTVADANCVPTNQLQHFLLDNGFLLGDADGDNQVQFSDFIILSANFGNGGQYTDGDFNKDGIVQFSDFLILSNNFGRAAATAVPEPTGIHFLMIGILGFVTFSKRRWDRTIAPANDQVSPYQSKITFSK